MIFWFLIGLVCGHWFVGSFWHEWRGGRAGVPTFWLKRTVWFPIWYNRVKRKVLGCRIDLHKFVGPDDLECYHTHPAWAIRIPFWGGYVEEVYDEHECYERTYLNIVIPFTVSLVHPDYAHRIDRLLNGKSSWSLWIRGPVVAPIRLVGSGWSKNAQPMQEV